MGSTRLPGKVVAPIGGVPALELELRRLAQARAVDEIVVATTERMEDDRVVELAQRCGVRVVRGDERDVLARYARAAAEVDADVVIRVTGDCPLLDASVVDRVAAALEPGVDYASNVLVRTFPVGLDVEALTRTALERVAQTAESEEAREHVTWHIRAEEPGAYVRRSVEDEVDNSDLRWTLDTAADLVRLRRIVEDLDLVRRPLPYLEVVDAVRARPELAA
jgi:spore coat polysaccharide biosynthesis protein SpsF (cytidylyltransferase family)